MNKSLPAIISLLLILLIPACQTNWQMDLQMNGVVIGSIDDDLVNFYVEELGDGSDSILLAYILYYHGFSLIDNIQLKVDDDKIHAFEWENLAEKLFINKHGEIIIEDVTFSPSAINIIPSPMTAEIEMTIMDLSPTMAQAIGLPTLPAAQDQIRTEIKAEHGVLILIDGLQYQKLDTLINFGLLPFFQEIEEMHQGVTVFPSITTSAMAALLTGAPPHENGVHGYGYRSTEMITLFDLAADHGKSVTAIEGNSLAFTLQNAKVTLSGDRDGNGFTDDNVLANTLEIILTEMPDLLFVHFHDVDDQGHRYGPDSPEYAEAIIRVDNYLSKIIEALPSDTFIIIFADHGMQNDTLSPGGNHGQLTKSAMIIPIFFLEK